MVDAIHVNVFRLEPGKLLGHGPFHVLDDGGGVLRAPVSIALCCQGFLLEETRIRKQGRNDGT